MAIFYITYSAWILSEIILNISRRSGKKDKKNQDKGSLRIIWITIAIANTVAILIANNIRFSISHIIIIPYIGLSIIIIGMIFRFYSIWILGKYFTVDVTIRENHKLVDLGIYKLVRHPSYLGSIISFIGFGLSLNNWLSLIIIGFSIIFVMLYRIKIEENLLISQFGQDYTDYQKRTYRLFPWIY